MATLADVHDVFTRPQAKKRPLEVQALGNAEVRLDVGLLQQPEEYEPQFYFQGDVNYIPDYDLDEEDNLVLGDDEEDVVFDATILIEVNLGKADDDKNGVSISAVANYNEAFSDLVTQLTDTTEEYGNDTVFRKGRELSVKLQAALANFIESPKNSQLFTSECEKAIDEAELIFKAHASSWNKVNPILKGFLGLLAFLPMLIPMIVSSTARQGYKETFFQTKPDITESLQPFRTKVTEVKDALQDDGENDPPSSPLAGN